MAFEILGGVYKIVNLLILTRSDMLKVKLSVSPLGEKGLKSFLGLYRLRCVVYIDAEHERENGMLLTLYPFQRSIVSDL